MRTERIQKGLPVLATGNAESASQRGSRACTADTLQSRAPRSTPRSTSKACSWCKIEQPLAAFNRRRASRDGRQGICRDCFKTKVHQQPEYKARALKRAQEYQARCPEKVRARRKLNHAIDSGKVLRPSCCERCGGEGRGDAHHHNGDDDPFDVQWLCRSCHVTLEPRRGVAA